MNNLKLLQANEPFRQGVLGRCEIVVTCNWKARVPESRLCIEEEILKRRTAVKNIPRQTFQAQTF